ncbi:hypothetical protein PTKIN_Ptkin08bG0014500 [Pterospermum kingtungense]
MMGIDNDLVRSQIKPNDDHSKPDTSGGTGKAATSYFTKAEISSLLQRFDSNEDGDLSKEELRNIFKSLGSSCASLRARLALHSVDKNGDGYINKEERDKLINYVLKRGYSHH